MPPILTIDDGRIAKATIELHRAGLISDEDILSDMGKDAEDFWPRKFEAAAKKEQAFEDAKKKSGLELDPRYKGMFTPNDMAPDTKEETDTKQPDESDSD